MLENVRFRSFVTTDDINSMGAQRACRSRIKLVSSKTAEHFMLFSYIEKQITLFNHSLLIFQEKAPPREEDVLWQSWQLNL